MSDTMDDYEVTFPGIIRAGSEAEAWKILHNIMFQSTQHITQTLKLQKIKPKIESREEKITRRVLKWREALLKYANETKIEAGVIQGIFKEIVEGCKRDPN